MAGDEETSLPAKGVRDCNCNLCCGIHRYSNHSSLKPFTRIRRKEELIGPWLRRANALGLRAFRRHRSITYFAATGQSPDAVGLKTSALQDTTALLTNTAREIARAQGAQEQLLDAQRNNNTTLKYMCIWELS
ncbi:hypothetical protein MtrunA17_Chr4g0009311 [Medicago truncatula]|uniref:Uncharacterized protein n=1 Tax=Medicago truncatula TaxID=3880 RepID=A0A396I0C9_MEDTR|nr:hypothetical protein MtrunA17_Chr4g0009311 [Medicago truncatula]